MKNNNTNPESICLISVIVMFLILNILFNLPVAALIASIYVAALMFVFLKTNWLMIMQGNGLTDIGDKLISIYKRVSKKITKEIMVRSE